MKMKNLKLAAILAVLAVLLVVPTAALVSSQEAPKVPKRFRYINPIPKPPGHFNVFVRGHVGHALCFDPLAYLNRANGTWYPWLATDWKLSKDGLKLTIHLRKGVKWSDGTPFTSKDVLTTWYCGRIMKWWYWKYIDKIEAPDDYTVVFYLKKPWIYAEFHILQRRINAPYSVYGNFSDAARKAIAEGNLKKLDELLTALTKFRPKKLIGTGPFEFVRLSTSEWLFRKRPDYWHGSDLIKFDEYMQMHLGTGPSEFAGILSRGGDFCTPDLTREIYEELKKREDIYVPVQSWHHGQALLFNTHKYPLSLLEVRQAIAYALNRSELCIAVSPHPDLGKHPIGPPDYPTGMLVGDEYKWIPEDILKKYFNKYEYNPKKTIEIFKKLGFKRGADGIWVTPNGTRLEFDIISAPWTDWALSCENTKAQLAKVGIKLNVYATEPVTCKRVPAGDFDMAYYCVLARFLPLPTEPFYRGFVSGYAKGMGSYGKVYDVPKEIWPTGKVNATELAMKLETTLDKEKFKKMVIALAYVANHYLPYLAVREKPCTYTYNFYDVVWPDPKKDPTFYKWAAYTEDAIWYYMINGLIYPREHIKVVEKTVEKPVEKIVEKRVEVVPTWVYGVVAVAIIIAIAAVAWALTRRH